MSEQEAMKEFKEGLHLLRSDLAKLALPHMLKACELDKKNPFYLSYLGLALAAAQGRWKEAQHLCDAALRMKRTQPEFYINLAEVHRLADRRDHAVETLTIGLQLTKRDARLAKALHGLGVRRTPLLTFLDRKHFLNRQLGKLRHRVLGLKARGR